MIKWTKKDTIKHITELKSPFEERFSGNGQKSRIGQIADRLRQAVVNR